LIREGEFLTNKRAKNEGKTREELSKTREKTGRLGGVSSGKSRREANENNELSEANEPYARAIDKIRGEGEEKEPTGSLSETSSDAPRKRGRNRPTPMTSRPSGASTPARRTCRRRRRLQAGGR